MGEMIFGDCLDIIERQGLGGIHLRSQRDVRTLARRLDEMEQVVNAARDYRTSSETMGTLAGRQASDPEVKESVQRGLAAWDALGVALAALAEKGGR